jgi:hypothetical protein
VGVEEGPAAGGGAGVAVGGGGCGFVGPCCNVVGISSLGTGILVSRPAKQKRLLTYRDTSTIVATRPCVRRGSHDYQSNGRAFSLVGIPGVKHLISGNSCSESFMIDKIKPAIHCCRCLEW